MEINAIGLFGGTGPVSAILPCHSAESLACVHGFFTRGLNTLLAQENSGLLVSSVTAEQFLCERRISCPKMEQEKAIGRTQEPRRVRTGTLTALPALVQTHMPEPVHKLQGVSTLESRRMELEMEVGGDHDLPYTFTLPGSVPQLLAWTRLMARVRQGELQP